MSNLDRSEFQGHPFHLVSPSPWPVLTSASLFTLPTSGVLSMHNFAFAGYWFYPAFILLISSMSLWFRDVISEGTYLGNHTLAVQRGLNMGVALFITSEALFFLAIFWAYFHSALSPTVELGTQWPPMGIEAINAFELPLLNTVILLSSGVTITYAHHSLIEGKRNSALFGTINTIILAIVFTAFQGIEYTVSSFTLTDGAFGSCFYFGTGLILAPIKPNLSPFWVTGFSDAESSFNIRVTKDNTRIHKIKISPIFSIELHIKDIALLNMIKEFFGVGTIIRRIRDGKITAIYSVQSIESIFKVIIPHFEKYPLLSQKLADFFFFKSCIQLMYDNKKLTEDQLMQILSFKGSMGKNVGLSATLLNLFPLMKGIKLERPVVKSENIYSPLWLAGFTSGEGMFYIKPVRIKGEISRFSLVFGLSQHKRDLHLFNLIKSFLNCGVIETKPSRPNEVNYFVTKLYDIRNIIIPFFENNNIIGIKSLDFSDFLKVSIIIEKEYKTKQDIYKIIYIKNGMNTKRKI